MGKTNYIMKKVTLILLVVFVCSFSFAGPKSIGIRTNICDNSISYQHYSGHKTDFIEIDATFRPTENFARILSVAYNFSIYEWKCSNADVFNVYAGAGLAGGYSNSLTFIRGMVQDKNGFDVYLPVQFGIEYQSKKSGWQISLDTRPYFGYHFYKDPERIVSTFNFLQAMCGLIPAIGIRYMF